MIARTLLALLLACLALPAMAAPMAHAPHPAQGALGVEHGGHDGHHPDAPAQQQPAPAHDCIGCIPPTQGHARVALPIRHMLILDARSIDAPVPAGTPSRPATPPPKPWS